MKTDGKFHKGCTAAGAVYLVAIEDVDAVTALTKMHIHHGKTLLFVYSAIILAFLPKEVNNLQNNSNDKKRPGTRTCCHILLGIGGKVRFSLKYWFYDGIMLQNC